MPSEEPAPKRLCWKYPFPSQHIFSHLLLDFFFLGLGSKPVLSTLGFSSHSLGSWAHELQSWGPPHLPSCTPTSSLRPSVLSHLPWNELCSVLCAPHKAIPQSCSPCAVRYLNAWLMALGRKTWGTLIRGDVFGWYCQCKMAAQPCEGRKCLFFFFFFSLLFFFPPSYGFLTIN